jgi:hypothetical protein
MRTNRRGSKLKRLAVSALLGALSAGLSGCAAAVIGAGAGGAGMAAYTDRGAKADLKGSVEALRSHVEAVYREKGLTIYERTTKNEGAQELVRGKAGAFDVTTTLSSSGQSLVHVEVVAKEDTLKWNKDYAKDLLSRIIARAP